MMQRELPSLAGQAWLNDARLQKVLSILNNNGETRVVGGAVRNALLEVPVADVDLATTLLPADVIETCKAAGLGVHPTGLEHGTVTVTHEKAAFEVTTLRRDVETDGRHAVVTFTQDWTEDAARRDFTMNAMYCDAFGKIYDFTESYADILKRRIRFVGRPSQRIQEDYLRILRFFRFQAFYGKGKPDEAGFKACVRLKAGLKILSAERVRHEMFKLLVAPHAVKVLKLMADARILQTFIPCTDEWRVLCRLPVDAVLRLFVLAREPGTLKERFRLSKGDAARLQAMTEAPEVSPKLTEQERRRMLYHLGEATWLDAVYLAWARSRPKLDDSKWGELLALPQQWTVPDFPLKGSDLLAVGFATGPNMGHVLASLEDWWVAGDFGPSKDDLLLRAGRYRT
jgi:poly(A) polymerase